MEKINTESMRIIGIHILIALKSFWQSAISILSGIVTLFFFIIGLAYLRTEGLLKEVPFEVNNTFFMLIDLLGNNWKYFMAVFFILYYITNWRDTERDF